MGHPRRRDGRGGPGVRGEPAAADDRPDGGSGAGARHGRRTLADTHPNLYTRITDEIAAVDEAYGPLPNEGRVIPMLVPVTGGTLFHVLTIAHVPDSGGSPNTAFEPALPQDYPIVATDGFNGAVAVAVRSNNSGGQWIVTYRIDEGAEQTFLLDLSRLG